MKTAFGLALFGKLVKLLFGIHDLGARLGFHIDLCRLGADILTELYQITAHGQIINHLRIITDRI